MAITFKELGDNRRAEYLSHVGAEILDRVRRPQLIGLAEWRRMRLNSYEFELVYPKLDDEALSQAASYCLKNCQRRDGRRPVDVYDDAAMVIFLPLLIDRLRKSAGIEAEAMYATPVRIEP